MKRNTTTHPRRGRAGLLNFLSKRPVRELCLFVGLVGLRTPIELVRAVRSHAEVWKDRVD